MQTQQYSDQQTIQRYTSPTLQNLLSQNKMKDLALSKATNLIELLNIQLQVERNTNQENVRQIEIQLQRKYESEIHFLKDRVSQLEKQLSKGGIISQSKQKGKTGLEATGRQTSFSRASSVKSFDNKKKRSVNKKYTENNTNQSNSKNDQILPFSICDKVMRNQVIEMQEWKQNIVDELEKIVKDQYEDLGDLINKIQSCGQDFEEVVKQSNHNTSINVVAEMGKIIKEQHKIINTWRAYVQELEDLYKSYFFKMQSLCTSPPKYSSKTQINFIQEVALSIRQKLRASKQNWQSHVNGLSHQNDQLKNILDSMIKLVKQQKKLKN